MLILLVISVRFSLYRPLVIKRLAIAILATLLTVPARSVASDLHNVGFYYGNEAPIGALMAYDWLVMQPSQVSSARTDILHKAGTLPLAYVSVGEITSEDPLITSVPNKGLLGTNPAWNSRVLDTRRADVRRFLLDKLIDPALAMGFEGVFLDTLDSFQLTDAGKSSPEAFRQAHAALIRSIRERRPNIKIIINRGFDLPEEAHDNVDALAFESWRNGYDASSDRYRPVPAEDRDWLTGKLDHWRASHPEKPVIAIDYTDDPQQAEALSRQLRKEGFIPYVADADLLRLGPTQPSRVRRHVLVVHDAPGGPHRSVAHDKGAILLEQLGYVPDYLGVDDPLPSEPVGDRYAGIMVWWQAGNSSVELCQWLSQQQAAGIPVVIFDQLPSGQACQSAIGANDMGVPAAPVRNQPLHDSVGEFEGHRLPAHPGRALPRAAGVNSWLTLQDSSGHTYSPVYTHQGGGAALYPYLFEPGPEDNLFWLFDPIAFLREALGGALYPAIDTTTESGRRILTSHIDGDGFVSRGEFPGAPLSAKVIEEEILKPYRIPHTVSVIEAETSPQGIHPDTSTEAEAIARSIFSLDNVEVASHSYSHPYFWGLLESGTLPDIGDTLYGYSLDIPGYTPTLENEIEGSVAYINRLAPDSKPVSVFLWTGNAFPGENALLHVRQAGLLNVNGGNTHPLPYTSELAGVYPVARPVGDELQIYAPVMNENVYTNLWTGPYYGFRDVVDTFKLLERKGRLKPISIYYHFYSGTKAAALDALHTVYDYALSQPVTPLYLSEYASRAKTLYRSSLQVSANGAFTWRAAQAPHTVRIDPQRQFPDLQRSEGVAGFDDAAGKRYVHLFGDHPELKLTDQPPQGPYLKNANAVITHWSRTRRGERWQVQAGLTGHQPVDLVIGGARMCQARNGQPLQGKTQEDGFHIQLESAGKASLVLECW